MVAPVTGAARRGAGRGAVEKMMRPRTRAMIRDVKRNRVRSVAVDPILHLEMYLRMPTVKTYAQHLASGDYGGRHAKIWREIACYRRQIGMCASKH